MIDDIVDSSKIICPYCKEVYWTVDEAVSEDDVTIVDCPDCGNRFRYAAEITITYLSSAQL